MKEVDNPLLRNVRFWRRPDPNTIIATDRLEDLVFANEVGKMVGMRFLDYSQTDQPGEVSRIISRDSTVIDEVQQVLEDLGHKEQK